MTLEKLLGSSADELEKLSDKDLEVWAAQYWNVTRPAHVKQAKSASNNTKVATAVKVKNEKLDKLRQRYKDKFGEELDL